MALIKCTECGKEISDKAAACPNCGAPVRTVNLNFISSTTSIPKVLKKAKREKKNGGCLIATIKGIGIFIVFNIVIGIFFGGSNNHSQESTSTSINKEAFSDGYESTEINTLQEATYTPEIIISGQKLYDTYTDNPDEYEKLYENQIIGLVAEMCYKNGKDSTELTLRSGFKDIKCYCRDGYAAPKNLSNKTIILVYGTCIASENSYEIRDCYFVEEYDAEKLAALEEQERENQQNTLDLNEEITPLSEEEFKAQCKELWHDDIFFSEESLEKQYVKLDLFVEEERFFKIEDAFVWPTSDFIEEYDIQRNFFYCGVQRKDEYSYIGGQINLFFSNQYDCSTSDVEIGDHLIVYGEIVEFSTNTTDGYNYCSVIPRYIENKGQ